MDISGNILSMRLITSSTYLGVEEVHKYEQESCWGLEIHWGEDFPSHLVPNF